MNPNNLKPCCYCLFAPDCTARAQFLAQVKKLKNSNVGAYVSSMGLTCNTYFKQFRAGDRVKFSYVADMQAFIDDGGFTYGVDYPDDEYLETIEGTITGWVRRKVKIFLDEPIETKGKENQIVLMYPRYDHKCTTQFFKTTGGNVGICKGGERPAGYDCKKCPWVCSGNPEYRDICEPFEETTIPDIEMEEIPW